MSSFGFGGTNFHAVLEAYADDREMPPPAACDDWPSELFMWRGDSSEVAAQVTALDEALARPVHLAMRDLAATVCANARGSGPVTVAVVAEGFADLRTKLSVVRRALLTPTPDLSDDSGVHIGATGSTRGRIAFLFPGQGSQYPGMLRELSVHFSEVRERWERADRTLARRFSRALSSYVFPPMPFQPQQQREHQDALTETTVAQPALGAAGLAAFRLLTALGVDPDVVAGHSYGEWPALCAAGVIDEETLYRLSEIRGRAMREVSGPGTGVMAAVSAGPEQVSDLLSGLADVWLSNLNAPAQTVISGTPEGVEAATARLRGAGFDCTPLPVACAFHSPLVAPAADRLGEALESADLSRPSLTVYANATADPYPADPAAVRALLARHIVSTVRFRDQVNAMYEAGVRVFIEAGPRAILTGLVQQTLGTQPCLTTALDGPPSGVRQLQTVLARLAAAGVPIRPDRLFRGRACRVLDMERLAEAAPSAPSPTAWLISGGGARPVRASRVTTGQQAGEADAGAPAGDLSELPASGSNDEGPGTVVLTRQSSTTVAIRGTGAMKPFHQVFSSKEGPEMSQTDSFPDSIDQVMLQYQQMMGHFLVTQERVMLAYLQSDHASDGYQGGEPAAAISSDGEPAAGIPAYGNRSDGLAVPEDLSPVPGPRLPMQSSVDPSPVSGPPDAVPEAQVRPSSDAPAEVGPHTVMKRLLEIISDRTGYPVDYLDLDLDLAADLGVDSIKKVEILGTFYRDSGLSWQRDSTAMLGVEKIRTIRDAVSAMASLVTNGNGDRNSAPAAINAEVGRERSSNENGSGFPADRDEFLRFVPGTVDAP